MPLIYIVVTLVVVGIILWLINTYVPMAGSIKAILNIVVVIATCVIVLQTLGLWNGTVGLWHKLKSRGAEAMDHHESRVQDPVAPSAPVQYPVVK